MSQEASPGAPDVQQLHKAVRVQGRIIPWHHDGTISVPLKAGVSYRVRGGQTFFYCPDGRHMVVVNGSPS